MSKILILTEENIYDRKGSFNAFLGRTKHLKHICSDNIDILLLGTHEPFLVRKLRHTVKHEKPKTFEVDGITMNIHWSNFSLIDYILQVKLHRAPFFKPRNYSRLARTLKGYDLIIAHSNVCADIARQVKALYGTPYTVTWHGSDIHTAPFNNTSYFATAKAIIEDADMNIFVSKALMATSDRITTAGNKTVLYNGYDKRFHRYPDDRRKQLRESLGVADKRVVVFVGSFVAVKNILKIPAIFRAVHQQVHNVVFWMVGDGKYHDQVVQLTQGLPIKLWGNQLPERVPDFLNAADVLILPSVNEGLPLSVVEGLACGCNVVGSRVGGIPEVIGDDNCVPTDDPNFEEHIAEKIVKYLQSDTPISQPLPLDFDWDRSAQKELNLINSIIHPTNVKES